MANTHSLEGIQCPRCKSLEPFVIEVTTRLTMYDSGARDHSDFEWNDDSWCLCVECEFEGPIRDFKHNL